MLFLEVTVLAVTELNTAAAHRHARCTMHDAVSPISVTPPRLPFTYLVAYPLLVGNLTIFANNKQHHIIN